MLISFNNLLFGTLGSGIIFYYQIGKKYKMDKPKRTAAESINEKGAKRLDELSPIENQPHREGPEPHADSRDDMEDEPLKDRQGLPINTSPKGMDA